MSENTNSLESDVAALKAAILNKPPKTEEQKRGSGSSGTQDAQVAKHDGPTNGASASAQSTSTVAHSEAAMEDAFKRKERLLREKMRSEMGKIQSKHQQLEEIRRSA
jgi:hypothetical protein